MTTIKCRKCGKVYPFNEKICPDCGYEEKLEVIITDDGIGSVTFHCKRCNRYTHFDGRRI